MAIRREELLPILARLQGQADVELSLEELAAEALLSPSHAQRAFAGAFGESAKQLTIRLRMERAAELLLSTNREIVEIAVAVGYESHEGFSRAFKARFGTAPRDYRAAYARPPARDSTTAGPASTIGSCVRFYRRPHRYWTDHAHSHAQPSRAPRTEEEGMSYEITRQERPETRMLAKSKRIATSQVADTLGEMLPAVYEFAVRNGIELTGPPTAKYEEWSAGGVTLTAGLPVANAGAGEGDIKPTTMPAGAYARTVHTGSYDSLNDAHEALEAWISSNGLEAGAASYEIYLTDPGQYPNEEDWKTEVLREIL